MKRYKEPSRVLKTLENHLFLSENENKASIRIIS